MLKFFVNRSLIALPTFVGVSVLAFSLIRLVPGDPVLLLLGERGATPEVYEQMQTALGLNKPLLTQYWLYISNAMSGDLGTSIISKRPVLQEFLDRFPATLELGVIALIVACLMGIPLGILAAVKRSSAIDYVVMGTSLVGYSMPIFWWGLILIMVFSVGLGLTPVSGRLSVLYDIEPVTGFMLIDTLLSDEGWPAFWDALRHLCLPAAALATIPLAVVARMTRSSMLEVLGEDYMRTARAKGLQPLYVLFVHGLRNALIPVITVIGLLFGTIVTGAILTESIFSWPGIGRWLLNSVTSRDYPVIQGGILLIAGLIVIINFTVDIVNTYVDPKLKGS